MKVTKYEFPDSIVIFALVGGLTSAALTGGWMSGALIGAFGSSLVRRIVPRSPMITGGLWGGTLGLLPGVLAHHQIIRGNLLSWPFLVGASVAMVCGLLATRRP